MAEFAVKPLRPDTWDTFAALPVRLTRGAAAYHPPQGVRGPGSSSRRNFWIVSFFVDRDYRRDGVSGAALWGALELVAGTGGGVVDGPLRHTWREGQCLVLYNGTRSLVEQVGFAYERPKGKNHCVKRAVIQSARSELSSNSCFLRGGGEEPPLGS